MEDKKTEQKKIKINSKIVYLVTFILVGLSIGAIVVFALNTPNTGYRVYSGSTNAAVKYNSDVLRCGYVDNYTGKSIFVPTKTVNEFSSLWLNPPTNVDVCGGLEVQSDIYWFDATNHCGSWDWNCDGEVTKKWETATGVRATGCVPLIPCDTGYVSDPTPDCGKWSMNGESNYWVTGDCCILPLPPPFLIWECCIDTRTQTCH